MCANTADTSHPSGVVRRRSASLRRSISALIRRRLAAAEAASRRPVSLLPLALLELFEVLPGDLVVWIELARVLQSIAHAVQIPRHHVGEARVGEVARIFRPMVRRLLERDDRLVDLALHEERDTELVLRVRLIRQERERTPERAFGRGRVALPPRHEAEPEVRLPQLVGLGGDLSQGLARDIEIALPRADRDLAGLLEAMLVARSREPETKTAGLRRGLRLRRRRQEPVELGERLVAAVGEDERAREIEPRRRRRAAIDRSAVQLDGALELAVAVQVRRVRRGRRPRRVIARDRLLERHPRGAIVAGGRARLSEARECRRRRVSGTLCALERGDRPRGVTLAQEHRAELGLRLRELRRRRLHAAKACRSRVERLALG